MNLTFTLNEEGDILNSTIRDSDTGSVMYTVDSTPEDAGGDFTTTVTKLDRNDGSTTRAFRIFWEGGTELDAACVEIGSGPSRTDGFARGTVLQQVPGACTYGALSIANAVYKWKSGWFGSKVLLWADDDITKVARSHSRRRGFFFWKPRDMSLEVSEVVEHAIDTILLTFILVWKEREAERAKPGLMVGPGNAFGQRSL